jgi:glycosyltransferase involved in cell wall biosynthesis
LFLWLPILKKLFGFSWVLVVHDVFPDNLVPAGILNNNTFLYRVADAFFSRAYSSADRLIVIGRDMERLLMKKTHGGVCTTYIPNWACDSEVFPLSKSDALFVEDLGWGNKIVFQFFGNIGRLQGIDVILEAIALTRNNEHAFLFIGGGAMVDKVEEFIDSHPDINVAYVGNLPLDDKVRGLAACDVAIVSLEAGMSGIGVPSKSYFSMAADKPIIALMDSGSEIADVVTAHDIGWHVEANDACGLAKVFDSISDCDIRMMRGRPRRVLVSRYSERAALDSYCDCVAELLT